VVEALVRKAWLQKLRKARGEIFNIGGTEEVSILELAKLVVKTLGSKSKIELIPYDQAYAPGFDDMRRRKPLVEKLERFVKFKPQTPLREIIRLTAFSSAAVVVRCQWRILAGTSCHESWLRAGRPYRRRENSVPRALFRIAGCELAVTRGNGSSRDWSFHRVLIQ
jgi:hypothetical protein